METCEIRYRVADDEQLVFDGKSWFIEWRGTRLNLEEDEAVSMTLPAINRRHAIADLLVRAAPSDMAFARKLLGRPTKDAESLGAEHQVQASKRLRQSLA